MRCHGFGFGDLQSSQLLRASRSRHQFMFTRAPSGRVGGQLNLLTVFEGTQLETSGQTYSSHSNSEL